MSNQYQIAVLGGGPGGYVAAIRAGQLGFKTVLIDKDNLGGVCLNWGCIPTKALLKNAELYDNIKNHGKDFGIYADNLTFNFQEIIKRSRTISEKISKNVEMLIKKNKVDRIRGFGKITASNKIEIFDKSGNNIQSITADNLIIATGAKPRIIPQIPVDRKNIITSSEAMTLEKLPKDLIVIGAGAIGIEFAYFYNVLGTKVTIIEMMDNILPSEDIEISQTLEKNLKKRGIDIYTKTIVEKAEVINDKVKVKILQNNSKQDLISEKVLNAIGVVGNIEGIGLENLGVEISNNHIKVDKQTYQTNIKGIYAIGDVIGAPWLAHLASAEAIHCVETIKGLNNIPIDYNNIPGCTYCQPQVASLGYTEQKCKELGIEYKVGKFPFLASGKAFAIGERDGFVKLIFDKKYDELLGAHIIGSEATEMIAELVLARFHGATAHSIAKTIHAHPTLSESIMEAAANYLNEAIHI